MFQAPAISYARGSHSIRHYRSFQCWTVAMRYRLMRAITRVYVHRCVFPTSCFCVIMAEKAHSKDIMVDHTYIVYCLCVNPQIIIRTSAENVGGNIRKLLSRVFVYTKCLLRYGVQNRQSSFPSPSRYFPPKIYQADHPLN